VIGRRATQWEMPDVPLNLGFELSSFPFAFLDVGMFAMMVANFVR